MLNNTIDNNFKIIPINNNDFIGLKNNIFSFSENIWNLSSLIRHNLQGLNKINYILNFSDIEETKLRNYIKKYAWYHLAKGRLKPQTLALHINVQFLGNIYVFMAHNNIKTFKKADNKILLSFIDFLNNKKLSSAIKANITKLFLDLCNSGIKYKWEDSPNSPLNLGESPYKYFKVDKNKNVYKDESIPDEIFNKIIQSALAENIYQVDYRTREQIITNKGKCKGIIRVNLERFGILAQAFTGLRISEILTLEKDCVERDGDVYWLSYTSSKTQREPTIKKIIIPELLYNELNTLIEITNDYRDILKTQNDSYSNAIINKIYINMSNSGYRPVGVAKATGWTGGAIKRFIKRNNITYKNQSMIEKLYPLHSHQFRHSFAKRLINDGVPLRIIKMHYSHVSIDMTLHYITIKQETLEKDYIETYVKSENIVTNGEIGDDFKALIEQVKTKKDMEDVLSMVGKRFGINPLPMGMCLLDFKKGHCTHTGTDGCHFSGCGDFVTNDSFLPVFEKQKTILEHEIERTKDNKFASMTYKVNLVKKEKITKIINSLKKDGLYEECK